MGFVSKVTYTIEQVLTYEIMPKSGYGKKKYFVFLYLCTPIAGANDFGSRCYLQALTFSCKFSDAFRISV